jgi:phage tail sheath gpL-like
MNISEPSVTLQIIPAEQLAGVQEQKVLIVGQMLAAGTAPAGDLIQDQPNDGSEDTLFGQRSHLAGLVREFKKLNKRTRLDIIPLDDNGAAVKATAVATVTGPATEAGSIFLTVGSAKNYRLEIDIADADTATDIGDAIVTAFTAETDAPFTAANAIGVVTFTAENGGTLADEWDIKVEGTVAGVAVALTGWTGGATDPTLTSVLDVIANIRYQTILWPSVYDVTVIEDELNTRFNSTNSVMDGIACQVLRGTLASLKAAVANLNSQSLCIIGNKTVSTTIHKGSATAEMPDVMCAQIVAIRSLRLTQDAPLTDFLTTVARSDQFGGIQIASLPYFNTSLPNLPVANAVDFFTTDELDELRDNGVAVVGPNRAFNGTIMGEFVTTYLTDIAANPDESYKFVNTVDTASVIREFYFENYKNNYAQTRLTDGDLIAGRDMANEASIRAFSNQLYDELADDVLTQSGFAAKKDYDDNLIIAVDISTGTVTINQAPLLVTQLRVILGTIQINFG